MMMEEKQRPPPERKNKPAKGTREASDRQRQNSRDRR